MPIASGSHIGEATPSDDNNPDVEQEQVSPTTNDSTRNNPTSHDTDPIETVAEDPQNLAEPSITINTHWTRSKDGIHKAKQPYVGLAETCTDEKEPENVIEALTRPQWKEAMDNEYRALMSNQTWVLVPYQG